MYLFRSATTLALAGAFSLFASTSFADALPPDDSQCEHQPAGKACFAENGDAGFCTGPEDCNATSYSCTLKLLEAGAGADAASCDYVATCYYCLPDASATVATDAGTPTITAPLTDGGAATPPANGNATATEDDSGGCSIGTPTVSQALRGAAPFALALLVPLALRRKKKKPSKDDATIS